MSNTTSVEKRIRDNISVNRQKVITAKAFIMNLNDEVIDTFNALKHFTSSQGFPKPIEFVIHHSVDIDEQIRNTSEYLSYKRAFLEGLIELIHSNLLFPLDGRLNSPGESIKWTTVVPGQGGTTSSWNFGYLTLPVPSQVQKSFSKVSTDFTLFEPDLYIKNLQVNNADEEVLEALSDSIECFKVGLYRPSLAMLGKAVEGAWIELGISLSKYAISIEKELEKNENMIENLKGQQGIAKKVDWITNLYISHYKDWFKLIFTKTDIKPFDLREAQNWTNIVRESRNAIHFGVKPSTENNYEKTSIMLLVAVKYFKMFYSIKEKADFLSRESKR